jgi:dTDP-4-amino-4,6-dideoxygalactose transaminase
MIYVTRSDLPEFNEYVEYLKRIWASRCLTNDGEFVQSLRQELKSFLKIKDLVIVSNGTLAIQLAFRALNLTGKGEVITTPFTFAATTNVILWEGLTPVFADIDPETFNLNPIDVEKKITSKTRAILAVHVYGNPCYVKELEAIAEKYNIRLLFDAAHAFGVDYDKQSVLNFGDVSTLSFHATKVFNTIEGGAIIAKDEKLYEQLRLMINHGIKSEIEVILPGTNAKMNEFQAALGLCNLKILEEKISLRRSIYERYKANLSKIPGLKFQKIVASRYNYSYMPVCFKSKEQRDRIYNVLLENSIKARKYFYPLTVDFDYFKKDKPQYIIRKGNLRNSETIADQILCLPLYPDLEISVVDKIIYIVSTVCKAY